MEEFRGDVETIPLRVPAIPTVTFVTGSVDAAQDTAAEIGRVCRTSQVGWLGDRSIS